MKVGDLVKYVPAAKVTVLGEVAEFDLEEMEPISGGDQ
jgi:hypothetical protein